MRIRPFLLGLLALVLILKGCAPPRDKAAAPDLKLERILQDGYEIPCFSRARGQLNYAYSGLGDKREKKAALRAVHSLFRENKETCGHAALGLAYIHLEPDYRFARPIDIRQAANDYGAALQEYASFPHVAAKALWYLGWIATDLEGRPDKGQAFFWRIVLEYPDTPMNLAPPVPWVNLVYPPDQAETGSGGTLKYWSQIALLEIVRHSRDPDQVMEAFNLLFDKFFPSAETGLAMKAILSDPILGPRLLPKVAPFLAKQTLNPYLARDIQALAGGLSP